ncbi:SCO family protein [Allorhizobium undicola]|uniref:SCO family protein n=1 Tax=Allorhizobium undicola TaxID=78527 RepID=UPI003D34B457
MTFNRLTIFTLAVAGLFVSALVGIMIWVSADSAKARPGPFNVKFSLIDDSGKPVDGEMFKGAPSLVYFGYTNCPEVCPTTLFEMADWVKALGSDADRMKLYFFTIDPERDTQEIMHAYVSAFSNRITGITGAPEEMQKVVNGWMVHAQKQTASNGDYHMSHTTSLLMIGPDGRLRGLIPYSAGRDVAISMIRASLLR